MTLPGTDTRTDVDTVPYIDHATNKRITRDLADFVLAELHKQGAPYQVDTDPNLTDHHAVYFDQPHNGARIFLSLVQGDADRVQVTGVYPQNRLYNVERFTATVARDRGPKAVADAIIKRIHPGYLPELARVKASHDEAVAAAKTRHATAERLSAVLGGDYRGTTEADASSVEFGYFRPGASSYGDVRINFRGDAVELRLRGLTPDQAEAVARVLREM